MKKILFFSCLLFSTMMMAQVNNTPTTIQGVESDFWAMSVIPQEFSFNGDNRICFYNAEESEVAIYNNDFQRTKLLKVVAKEGETKYVYEERQKIGTEAYAYDKNEQVHAINQYDSENNYIGTTDYIPSEWTTSDVIAYIENYMGYTIRTTQNQTDGSIMLLIDDQYYYYNYEVYGYQYPKEYFLIREGQLFDITISYTERDKYSDEWTITDTGTETDYFYGTTITDFDSPNANFDHEFLLTQTLFHADESYEYINYTHTIPSEPTYEWCNNHDSYYDYETQQNVDECISRYTYYSSIITGFEIKQDNGNVLQSFTFPNGFTMSGYHKDYLTSIAKISNNYYLIFSGEIDDESAMLVYKINSTNTGASVQQVSAPIKVGAYPNPATRNQTLTIQLTGENAGKGATELQVTDLQGRTIDSRTIPAGQEQTTIPTSHFAPGMNLIHILQNGTTIGTEKVIVK